MSLARGVRAPCGDAQPGHRRRPEPQRAPPDVRAPNGFGDELRAVLADDDAPWGALTLMRGSDREPFSPADAALVEAVTQQLAEGLRRAVLLNRDAPGPTDDEEAGARRRA